MIINWSKDTAVTGEPVGTDRLVEKGWVHFIVRRMVGGQDPAPFDEVPHAVYDDYLLRLLLDQCP